MDLKITYIQSDDQFIRVWAQKNERRASQIDELLQKYSPYHEVRNYERPAPCVGVIAVAHYSNHYYRGRILAVEDGRCYVHLIDIGPKVVLSDQNLLTFYGVPEFQNINDPGQAVSFLLAGALANKKWQENEVTFVTELVTKNNYSCILIGQVLDEYLIKVVINSKIDLATIIANKNLGTPFDSDSQVQFLNQRKARERQSSNLQPKPTELNSQNDQQFPTVSHFQLPSAEASRSSRAPLPNMSHQQFTKSIGTQQQEFIGSHHPTQSISQSQQTIPSLPAKQLVGPHLTQNSTGVYQNEQITTRLNTQPSPENFSTHQSVSVHRLINTSQQPPAIQPSHLVNRNFTQLPPSGISSVPIAGVPSVVPQTAMVNQATQYQLPIQYPPLVTSPAPIHASPGQYAYYPVPPVVQLPGMTLMEPPMARKQYIIERLSPGTVHKGFVSYILDGFDQFAIQLQEDSEILLRSLMRKLDATPRIKYSSVMYVGAPCLGPYVEDGTLCRATVSNISNESALLYFVDFGNTERLPLDQIYDIPAEFMTTKVMAHRFTLANLQSSFKSEDCKELFAEMVSGETLITIQVTEPEGPLNYCNIYLNCNGEQVNIKEKIKEALNETEGSTYDKPELPHRGSKCSVLVSHVSSPELFYVQIWDNVDILKAIMRNMGESQKVKTGSLMIEDLSPDMPVSARFPEDRKWYRGMVTEVNPRDDTAKVLFVDYGNEETLSSSDIRKIKYNSIAEAPVLAIQCKLDGCKFADDSSAIFDLFEEMILEKTFTMTVINKLPSDVLLVELKDENGVSVVDILNQEAIVETSREEISSPPAGRMAKGGNVKSVSPEDISSYKRSDSSMDSKRGQKTSWRSDSQEEDGRYGKSSWRSNSDEPPRSSKTTWRNSSQETDEGNTDWQSRDKSRYEPSKATQRINKIREVEDEPSAPPSRATQRINKIREVEEEPAQSQFKGRADSEGEWRTDKEYRGGRNRSRDETDGEYGKRDFKSDNKGRRNERTFENRAKEDNNEFGWNSSKRYDDKKSFRNKFTNSNDDNEWNADAKTTASSFGSRDSEWKGKTDNSFGSRDTEWKAKNDNSFGSRDSEWKGKNDNSFGSRDTEWKGKNDNSFGSRDTEWKGKNDNTFGSRDKEWKGKTDNNFEDRKRRDKNFEDKSRFGGERQGGRSDTDRKPFGRREFGGRKEGFKSAAPELLDGYEKGAVLTQATYEENRTIEGEITWFVNPSKFYVQPKNSEDFRTMVNEMQLDYLKRKPTVQSSVVVGDCVVARFSDDGIIYRAIVKEVNSTGITVEFVDFGNESKCSASDVWIISEEHCKIPIYAIKCALDGAIQPEGGEWVEAGNVDQDRQFQDVYDVKFRQFNSTDNTWNVELINKNGQNVLDKLVELGFAQKKARGIAGITEEYPLDLNLLVDQVMFVHVATAHDSTQFYVHLYPNYAKTIHDYVAQLKIENLIKVKDEEILEDMCYLISTDGTEWYRGRIISVKPEERIAGIEYLDFGSFDDVSFDNIRVLPNELVIYDGQATECMLDREEMIFTDEQELEFKNNIDGKDLFIRVNQVIECRLSVTLYEETGVRVPFPCEKDDRINLLSPLLVARHKERVVISEIADESSVYLQYLRDTQLLEELATKLNEHYDNKEQEEFEISVGSRYAVYSASFSGWYRAIVTSITSESEYNVLYVDYGNTEVIATKESIKTLDEIHLLQSELSLKVKVGVKFDLEKREELMECFQSVTFEAYLTKKKDVGWFADLKCEVKSLLDLTKEINGGSDMEDEEEEQEKYSAFWHLLWNDRLTVTMINNESASDFWIQLQKDEEDVKKLQACIKGTLTSIIPSITGKQEGNFAIKSVDDDQWYRCREEEGIEDSVRLIDFGFLEYTNNFIKRLPVGISDINDYAICGKLMVECAGDDEKFAERFKSITDEAVVVEAEPWFVVQNTIMMDLLIDGTRSINDMIVTEQVGKWKMHELIVLNFISSDKFYVQLNSSLESLGKLEEMFEAAESWPVVEKPIEGEMYASKDPSNGLWGRVVIDMENEEEVKALLIDYGEQVVCKEFRKLPLGIKKVPPMAIECCLRDNVDLTEELTDKLAEFISRDDVKLYGKFTIKEKPFPIELYCDGKPVLDLISELKDNVTLQDPSSVDVDYSDVVVVSHYNSLNSFYIKKEDSEIFDFTDLVDSWPICETPKIGLLVAAKFPEDGVWYRARITDIDVEGNVTVLYVDYGNTSLATELRLLPEDIGKKLAQAMHCSLYLPEWEVVWPPGAGEKFEELAFTPEAVFKVKIISKGNPGIVKLEDGGTNIADEIVAECKADMIHSQAKGNIPIAITYVESLSKFWAQTQSTVMRKLTKQLAKASDFEDVAERTVGLMVAAFNEDKNMWARGEILTEEECKVKLIDFGYEVTASKVKLLPEDFTSEPPIGRFCKLKLPEGLSEWPEHAEELFNKWIERNPLFDLKIIEEGDVVNTVSLFKRDLELSDIIVEADENNKELDSLSSRSVFENVIILSHESPSDFWVQVESVILEDIQNKLNRMPLMEYIDSEDCDINVGSIVAAKYPEDGVFYRAKIFSLTGGETLTADVLFIDYGNTATVHTLYQVQEVAASIPSLAMRCSLILPDGVTAWPEVVRDNLLEMFASELKMEIVERGDLNLVRLYLNGEDIVTVAYDQFKDVSFSAADVEEFESEEKVEEPYFEKPDEIASDDVTDEKPKESVTISHINNPGSFYVQRLDAPLAEVAEALMEGEKFEAVSGVIMGMLVAAKSSEDNLWYRAKVVDIGEEEGDVQVLFIDYGNSCTTKEIKELPKHLQDMPAHAKHCQFFLYRSDLDDWPANISDEFEDMVLIGNPVFELTVVEEGDPCIVNLRDGDVDVSNNINYLLKSYARDDGGKCETEDEGNTKDDFKENEEEGVTSVENDDSVESGVRQVESKDELDDTVDAEDANVVLNEVPVKDEEIITTCDSNDKDNQVSSEEESEITVKEIEKTTSDNAEENSVTIEESATDSEMNLTDPDPEVISATSNLEIKNISTAESNKVELENPGDRQMQSEAAAVESKDDAVTLDESHDQDDLETDKSENVVKENAVEPKADSDNVKLDKDVKIEEVIVAETSVTVSKEKQTVTKEKCASVTKLIENGTITELEEKYSVSELDSVEISDDNASCDGTSGDKKENLSQLDISSGTFSSPCPSEVSEDFTSC